MYNYEILLKQTPLDFGKNCNSSDGPSSCLRKAPGTRSLGRQPDVKSDKKAFMQTKACLQHIFLSDLPPV